eukprot:COSAG02_NODE_63085_length_264_cov_0.624242_1_plen_36_part_10
MPGVIAIMRACRHLVGGREALMHHCHFVRLAPTSTP